MPRGCGLKFRTLGRFGNQGASHYSGWERRGAADPKRVATICFPSNAASKAIVGPASLIGGFVAPPHEKNDGIYRSQGVDLRFDAAQVIRAGVPSGPRLRGAAAWSRND